MLAKQKFANICTQANKFHSIITMFKNFIVIDSFKDMVRLKQR